MLFKLYKQHLQGRPIFSILLDVDAQSIDVSYEIHDASPI